ncbi:MAG: hypothetical protein LBJ32_01955 [Oscillospiraceae bacterium]|jgi:hypothetical protein|nr:hypothetical protein [Oscillospiraceae bacterium]
MSKKINKFKALSIILSSVVSLSSVTRGIGSDPSIVSNPKENSNKKNVNEGSKLNDLEKNIGSGKVESNEINKKKLESIFNEINKINEEIPNQNLYNPNNNELESIFNKFNKEISNKRINMPRRHNQNLQDLGLNIKKQKLTTYLPLISFLPVGHILVGGFFTITNGFRYFIINPIKNFCNRKTKKLSDKIFTQIFKEDGICFDQEEKDLMKKNPCKFLLMINHQIFVVLMPIFGISLGSYLTQTMNPNNCTDFVRMVSKNLLDVFIFFQTNVASEMNESEKQKIKKEIVLSNIGVLTTLLLEIVYPELDPSGEILEKTSALKLFSELFSDLIINYNKI